MNFGKAIRSLRKELGLSQDQLAKMSKITQAALSQIERGKRPGAATLKKISEALSVPESMIYVMALDREEVPEQNRLLYDQLFPLIQDLVRQLATTNKSAR